MDELAVILLMFANLWRARNLAIADRSLVGGLDHIGFIQFSNVRDEEVLVNSTPYITTHSTWNFFRNCFPGVCFYISVLVISRTGIPEHRISPNRLHKQLCVENHLKSGKGTEITGYYKKSEAVQNATARKRNRKNWTPKWLSGNMPKTPQPKLAKGNK